MNYEKLNGLWKGSYKYGNKYPAAYKIRVESFTLDIQFDGVNFKGFCHDQFTKTYFNKPAMVEGTFVPNLISFIKKYPGLLVTDEGGQTSVALDRPPVEINYTGLFYKSFFTPTIRFEGEWIITSFLLDATGKKEHYSVDGTWMMKK